MGPTTFPSVESLQMVHIELEETAACPPAGPRRPASWHSTGGLASFPPSYRRTGPPSGILMADSAVPGNLTMERTAAWHSSGARASPTKLGKVAHVSETLKSTMR